jgi:hypothetical protein
MPLYFDLAESFSWIQLAFQCVTNCLALAMLCWPSTLVFVLCSKVIFIIICLPVTCDYKFVFRSSTHFIVFAYNNNLHTYRKMTVLACSDMYWTWFRFASSAGIMNQNQICMPMWSSHYVCRFCILMDKIILSHAGQLHVLNDFKNLYDGFLHFWIEVLFWQCSYRLGTLLVILTCWSDKIIFLNLW